MLKKIDWRTWPSMAVFLGGLEYVLEEGPRHDGSATRPSPTAAWLSFVGLRCSSSSARSAPAARSCRLTPFRKPTFAFACVFNLVIGFGLYSSTYLMPVFLGRVRGYDSLQIGTTVFVTGVAQIAFGGDRRAAVAARRPAHGDHRRPDPVRRQPVADVHVTAGLGLLAPCSAPQALRGFAIMLCIVPSVGMALTGFGMAELRYASGLFNLMRNLGGAIGIAVVNTWLADNTRIQAARMGESLGEAGRTRARLRRRAGRPHRPDRRRSRPGAAAGPGRARPAGRPPRPDLRLRGGVPPDGVAVPRRPGDGPLLPPGPSTAAAARRRPLMRPRDPDDHASATALLALARRRALAGLRRRAGLPAGPTSR